VYGDNHSGFPIFRTLPENHATRHTQVSQRTPQFTAVSTSSPISSQSAAFNVLTADTKQSSVAVMIFYSPEYTQCVRFDSGRVTAVKNAFEILSPSANDVLVIVELSKTPFCRDGSSNIRCFSAEAQDAFPVIGIHFMSKIIPRLHFGLFCHEDCGLPCLSVRQMQRSFGFVLKQWCIAKKGRARTPFRLVFKSICNEVFTFIKLQTKISVNF